MSFDLADVPPELRDEVAAALAQAGVEEGHLSVALVDRDRIRELNREHRSRDAATDVLAFPIDEGETAGPRELGDVVICPPEASDVAEAAIHGVLHLCGYDHEADDGEMLELQARIISSLERPTASDQRPTTRMIRVGFIGLAGRPNVGKSTLVNAIVGAKVAIVSDRPQTTRRAVRGIATDVEAGWQLALIDLPGVQRPRDSLTSRMQSRVARELADADAALFVVNGEQGIGPGDRFISRAMLAASDDGGRIPVVCAVNKCDRLSPAETAAVLSATAQLDSVDDVFPVSARTGEGLEALVSHLATLVPEGPLLYPPADHTDQASDVHLAELIREQILRRTREEIPHAVEVVVEEITTRDDGLVEVPAQIWVEEESQKGILIGRGGSMVREIGTAARRELERELDAKVFLDLEVRVRDRWRRDEGALDQLGID